MVFANSGSRVQLVADSNSGVDGAALGLISKTVDYNAQTTSDMVYHQLLQLPVRR